MSARQYEHLGKRTSLFLIIKFNFILDPYYFSLFFYHMNFMSTEHIYSFNPIFDKLFPKLNRHKSTCLATKIAVPVAKIGLLSQLHRDGQNCSQKSEQLMYDVVLTKKLLQTASTICFFGKFFGYGKASVAQLKAKIMSRLI